MKTAISQQDVGTDEGPTLKWALSRSGRGLSRQVQGELMILLATLQISGCHPPQPVSTPSSTV